MKWSQEPECVGQSAVHRVRDAISVSVSARGPEIVPKMSFEVWRWMPNWGRALRWARTSPVHKVREREGGGVVWSLE